MFRTKLLAIAMLLIVAGTAQAHLPRPVDLGIQNIPQETEVWCWAAVAQQIIHAVRGVGGTPPQCGLVAAASNVPAGYCCQSPSPCRRTGSFHEIGGLIAAFGGRASNLAPPTDPATLYATLANRRAVIMGVRATPWAAHVVVIRGMHWIPTPRGPQALLLVNDPMGYFTQTIPFDALLPYWDSALVVY